VIEVVSEMVGEVSVAWFVVWSKVTIELVMVKLLLFLVEWETVEQLLMLVIELILVVEGL